MIGNKFCPMPFGSMHIDPNGQIKICCSDNENMADENGKPYNVQTHTLKEAWNSNHYKKIRLDFLSGKQPPSCFQCWDNEVGDKGKSTRTSSLELYQRLEHKGFNLSSAINEAKENNGEIVNSKPADFQIQSGNLCNLACKMCFPLYSNGWSKFFINKNINANEIKFHSGTHTSDIYYPDFGVEHNWPKTTTMSKIFSDYIDNIYNMNITGGEPTLLVENIEFIEFLKTSKNIDNLAFMIITNATNVNKRLLNALDGFNTLTLINSLDGMDEIAYIQRTPSHWPTIFENFKAMKRFSTGKPNVNHCIISVVTALNIHHLGYFWNYLVTHPEIRLHPDKISPQVVIKKFESTGLENVPRRVIQKIRDQFVQYHLLKGSVAYERMLNYLDNVEWADDDTQMLEILDTMQKLHPDLDIKKIYSIYYE